MTIEANISVHKKCS